jgi:hypothetical protein
MKARFLQLVRPFSLGFPFILLLSLAACEEKIPDEKRVLGYWGMGFISMNGQDVSNGKEWFEFQENGQMNLMTTNGKKEQKFWMIHPERKKLSLKASERDSLEYDYRFGNDTLMLNAFVGGSQKVQICLHKIPEKPAPKP